MTMTVIILINIIITTIVVIVRVVLLWLLSLCFLLLWLWLSVLSFSTLLWWLSLLLFLVYTNIYIYIYATWKSWISTVGWEIQHIANPNSPTPSSKCMAWHLTPVHGPWMLHPSTFSGWDTASCLFDPKMDSPRTKKTLTNQRTKIRMSSSG